MEHALKQQQKKVNDMNIHGRTDLLRLRTVA